MSFPATLTPPPARRVTLSASLWADVVSSHSSRQAASHARARPWWPELCWLGSVTSVAITLAWFCYVPGDLSTEAMVLLSGVLVLSLRCRRWLAMLGVVVLAAAFNFLFTEPRFTLRVTEPEALVACVVMLLLGVVVTSLVQRSRASAEHAAAREQEASAERLRSNLLASVSHDLRTPLTSIKGAASAMLGEAALPEAARSDLLQGIVDEASRLNELIANLLFATRFDSGEVTVRREWLDLGELAGAALRRAEPQLGARAIDVDVCVGAPLVEGDPVLLEQAVFALLDNVARHTPTTCGVCLRVCCQAGRVWLEVEDTGAGIAADVAARLFQRFERGPHSGGIGLGLAIAAAIARAHGGTLELARVGGPGALFRLSLPSPAHQPTVPREPATEVAP